LIASPVPFEILTATFVADEDFDAGAGPINGSGSGAVARMSRSGLRGRY
jgi:hypothetical protein